MRIAAIGCRWSQFPPSSNRREAVIVLSNDNEDCDEIPIYKMGNVDGTFNSVARMIKSEPSAKELLTIIHDDFDFTDLKYVRFIGECLTPEVYQIVKSFSIAVVEMDDDLSIIVETSLKPQGAADRMELLAKRKIPLVDAVCFYVHVPSTENQSTIDTLMPNIISSLTGCLALSQIAMNVVLCFGVDDDSSMESFTKSIDELLDSCNADDRFDMKNLAVNAFTVSMYPITCSDSVNSFVSDACEYLADKNISREQINTIRYSVFNDPSGFFEN